MYKLYMEGKGERFPPACPLTAALTVLLTVPLTVPLISVVGSHRPAGWTTRLQLSTLSFVVELDFRALLPCLH